MDAKEVRAAIRARVKELGSQRAVANELRVSVQYLNDVLRGRRDPGDKLLKGLGLQRQVDYVERV
jgi:transcriptional regulator with XRE-family HTH domain